MMMRVIISSNWAPYVGTDYTEALGIYDNLEQAAGDALDYAWDKWEGSDDDDEDAMEDEGPDFCVEEYDPDVHDCQRVGGGSFVDDFEQLER